METRSRSGMRIIEIVLVLVSAAVIGDACKKNDDTGQPSGHATLSPCEQMKVWHCDVDAAPSVVRENHKDPATRRSSCENWSAHAQKHNNAFCDREMRALLEANQMMYGGK